MEEVHLERGDLFLNKSCVAVAIEHPSTGPYKDIFLQPMRPLGDISYHYPCTDAIMEAMIEDRKRYYQRHVDVFLESIANDMRRQWAIDKKELEQPKLL